MTSYKQRKLPQVPDFLVKEILEGMPVYYKGYKTVLRKEKTLEEIMGASGLQIFIIRYLVRLLDRNLDENLYYVFSGEGGIHIDLANNLAGNILVFEKSQLNPKQIDTHYLNVAPKINIEIDVAIDNSNYDDFEYIQRKTKKLLSFGTEKVIWILTKSRQIIVAETDKDWLLIDWAKDVEVLNGIFLNIPAYLK